MAHPHYLTKLNQLSALSASEQIKLEPVTNAFTFRTNDYYNSLIDWSDPDDPIRRIIVPVLGELTAWGDLDASREADYTVVPGLEHKYHDTALLLINDICGAYCRFCFRKRLFLEENAEVIRDITRGVEYIRSHREITNVLLTGGDPLILATSHLDEVLSKLRTIDHVKIVRIGSKMPAFAPSRITGDPSLLKMLRHHSTPEKRIYIMAHYNHPRELTAESRDAITALLASGSIVVNQTPLIRGVNDEASTLAELLDALSFIGVSPYYIFQCRPTVGNKPYSLPVEEGFRVFQEAQRKCSGLAARVRFVMSHTTGKIEVVGLSEDKIFMRYHRVPAVGALDRMFMFPRNPEAHWFDDYCSVPQPLPSKTSAT